MSVRRDGVTGQKPPIKPRFFTDLHELSQVSFMLLFVPQRVSLRQILADYLPYKTEKGCPEKGSHKFFILFLLLFLLPTILNRIVNHLPGVFQKLIFTIIKPTKTEEGLHCPAVASAF